MIAISLGGSVINGNGKIDIKFVKQFTNIINKEKQKIGIVCGGGFTARLYANALKKIKNNNFYADEIGIISTKQNGLLVLSGLKNAYPKIISNFDEAKNAINKYKTIVMSGLIPGMSTDTIAVLLAECINAKKLINISNIDGIYNKNPKKYKDSKKIKKMSHDELIKLAIKSDTRKAGEHFVFDLFACKLAKRSNIELHFINNEIKTIKKALNGKKHKGTIVQ